MCDSSSSFAPLSSSQPHLPSVSLLISRPRVKSITTLRWEGACANVYLTFLSPARSFVGGQIKRRGITILLRDDDLILQWESERHSTWTRKRRDYMRATYKIYDYPSEEEERLPSISPRPIYEGDCWSSSMDRRWIKNCNRRPRHAPVPLTPNFRCHPPSETHNILWGRKMSVTLGLGFPSA